MRNHLGRVVRRVALGALSLAALSTPGGAVAVPQGDEAARVEFRQRYQAVQHGGIARAANAAVTCRSGTSAGSVSCLAARSGASVRNGDFDMFYTDLDDDPDTYNSTSAELRLPAGARVTYARLYWGGNLRVGEQKPAEDNGRVLLAEPGGHYRQVLADTSAGHRVTAGADAYQASADVTDLVRTAGPGSYTVAQINVAMGKSEAGAWGGWTLVTAYEKASEPLRHLALWDGFDVFDGTHRDRTVQLGPMTIPARATGQVGLVAYNGDRGTTGDKLTLITGRGTPLALGDAQNPAGDVLNSSIGEPGRVPAQRLPSYANTLGYDSDILTLDRGLTRGGTRLGFRLESAKDTAWFGALFAAVDVKP